GGRRAPVAFRLLQARRGPGRGTHAPAPLARRARLTSVVAGDPPATTGGVRSEGTVAGHARPPRGVPRRRRPPARGEDAGSGTAPRSTTRAPSATPGAKQALRAYPASTEGRGRRPGRTRRHRPGCPRVPGRDVPCRVPGGAA